MLTEIQPLSKFYFEFLHRVMKFVALNLYSLQQLSKILDFFQIFPICNYQSFVYFSNHLPVLSNITSIYLQLPEHHRYFHAQYTESHTHTHTHTHTHHDPSTVRTCEHLVGYGWWLTIRHNGLHNADVWELHNAIVT